MCDIYGTISYIPFVFCSVIRLMIDWDSRYAYPLVRRDRAFVISHCPPSKSFDFVSAPQNSPLVFDHLTIFRAKKSYFLRILGDVALCPDSGFLLFRLLWIPILTAHSNSFSIMGSVDFWLRCISVLLSAFSSSTQHAELLTFSGPSAENDRRAPSLMPVGREVCVSFPSSVLLQRW